MNGENRKKDRIVYIDLIRLFACFCIITVHFNATVSGFDIFGKFEYANSLIPNRYLGVYLGDIGVSLFFMISGASLMLSNEHTKLTEFYRKRFLNIYPMFWIAFAAATGLAFVLDGKLPALPARKMIYSILGYDGYLSALGLVHGTFYQIGEWFLGCVISLYIIWPLLRKGMQEAPAVVWAGSILLNIAVYFIFKPGYVYKNWFFVRIPEILFGMTIVKYRLDRYPVRVLGAAFIAVAAARFLPQDPLGSWIFNVSLCAVLFAVLMAVGRFITQPAVKTCIVWASGLTYPLFLVHHWIISRIAQRIDLSLLGGWKIWALYGVYLVTITVAAWLLKTVGSKTVQLIWK